MIECQVVDPDMNDFSGNSFAVLIYYFEVGDVGTWVVARFTVDVSCTAYMASIFFHSISRHLLESPMYD